MEKQNQLYNKFKLLLHTIVDAENKNEATKMKLYLCRRFCQELSNNNDSETETETKSEESETEDLIKDFVKECQKNEDIKIHLVHMIEKDIDTNNFKSKKYYF